MAGRGRILERLASMRDDFPENTRDRLKLLDNARVVLVSPKFPGNLGMTARAMTNCGFKDLRLISPRAELNKEAYQLAVIGAEILDDAIISDDLARETRDCALVVGTTRRKGGLRRNFLSPEEAADMIRSSIAVNKVAIVFGAEDNGISNEDLELCHWIVSMHTGSEQESFNLSHSVALVLYLINRAVVSHKGGPRKLARAADLEHMFEDMGLFLLEIGFIHERDPKRMVSTLKHIFHRSGLSDRDVKIIRGIMRQARWRIENPDAELVPRDTPQQIKREILKKQRGEENE